MINTKNKPYAYQAIVRDVTENYELDLKIKEQLEVKKFEALILKDLLTSNDIFNNAWNAQSGQNIRKLSRTLILLTNSDALCLN